jgi:hypothetical protein
MKATTLLLAQHHRIQKLVDRAALDARARDERTAELLEAVVTYLSTEETVLCPTLERELELDLREHRAAHVRARLALFRVATAPTHSEGFISHLSWLDRVLHDLALIESGVVRSLEEALDEQTLRGLGARMLEFQRALVARPAFAGRRETALAS